MVEQFRYDPINNKFHEPFTTPLYHKHILEHSIAKSTLPETLKKIALDTLSKSSLDGPLYSVTNTFYENLINNPSVNYEHLNEIKNTMTKNTNLYVSHHATLGTAFEQERVHDLTPKVRDIHLNKDDFNKLKNHLMDKLNFKPSRDARDADEYPSSSILAIMDSTIVLNYKAAGDIYDAILDWDKVRQAAKTLNTKTDDEVGGHPQSLPPTVKKDLSPTP